MSVSISGSVGDAGGRNRPEDVRTVYSLFNKILSIPLAVSDQVSDELIAAIRNFQKAFMSNPDGRIDVGGRTWGKLTTAADGSGTPETEITGSVGQGGQNRPSDVRIVYALFNKILSTPLTVSDQVSDELIQTIKAFQQPFLSRPDGRIDVGGRTWGKFITATEMPETEVPENPDPDDPTLPGEINLGGANAAWTARHQWNDSYEAEFSRWVEQLFADRKGSLTACLRNSSGNSLYSAEDRNISIYCDCADLPYLVRAYFSYKKKLPFSFNSTISGSRYSNNNRPGSRRSFLSYSNFARMARAISNSVHSGFFRFFWTMEKTDTYLCQVNRESIVPGTIYYDANGHLLVVSKVEDDGTVRFVDAHPDNSLTGKRFGGHMARGYCKQGGGFRRWREQKVSSSGSFILTSNRSLRFFDSGKSQCQSGYRVDGIDLNYHGWVKRMLTTGSGRIDPVREIRQQLAALDEALQERVEAVDAAVSRGIHQKPHPSSLPYNIYGTEGEWESYSSPGRDARLKAQIREMFNLIRQSVTAVASGNHPYEFSGSAEELVREYDALWRAASSDIQVRYTDSGGDKVTLTLGEIMERLFKLSFDPYHCPELRWGDTEAASCPDGSSKRRWYEQEQRLRNAIDKNNQAHTTLDWGPRHTPDIHIGDLLTRLKQEYA